MVEIWITIVASLGSAILGAILTYYLFQKSEKSRRRYEEAKEERNKLEKAYALRPRFDISRYKENQSFGKITKSIDLNALVLKIQDVVIEDNQVKFIYNNQANVNDNLVYYEYKLKNIGDTEISYFSIANNLVKNASIVNLEHKNLLLNDNLLLYEANSNTRFIKKKSIHSCKDLLL